MTPRAKSSRSAQTPPLEPPAGDRPPTIRILFLEGALPVAARVKKLLESADGLLTCIRSATNKNDFLQALQESSWDVILCDYQSHALRCDEALEFSRSVHPHVPVIIITSELGEEKAVKTLKSGAADYVLKDHLRRLVPSIKRLLEQAALARERQENEERYRRIVENAQEGIWTMDADRRTLYVNEGMARMLGYTVEEMMVKPWTDLVSPGQHQDVSDRRVQEYKQGTRRAPESSEMHFRRKDGTTLWAIVHSTPFFNDHGEYTGSITMLSDISERKRIEERLRESEKKYRTIVETAREGIVIAEPEGSFTFVNERMAEMLGYGVEEILGKSSVDFADEEWHGTIIETRQGLHEGIGIEGEFKFRRKDGAVLWSWYNATPMLNDAGEHVANLAMHMDITERKEAQERMEHIARFPGENPHPVLRATPEGTLEYANASSAIVLKAWNCAVGKEVPDDWRQIIQHVFSSGKMESQDLECAGRSFSFTVVPVPEGPYINLYGREITEQRRIEAELHRAEREKAEFLESIEDPFYGLDSQWRYTYVNTKAAAFMAKAPEELLGKNIWEVFPQVRGSESERQMRKAMKERIPVHFEVQSTLNHVWVEVHIFPKADGGLSVLYRDIRERKRVEEMLRESEERFHIMADSTPVMIWVTNARGEIQMVNHAYEEFFGVREDEVITPGSWKMRMHPDDEDQYTAAFTKAVQDRVPFNAEGRVKDRFGHWRWVRSFGAPRFAGDGTFLGHVGSSPDITEEKGASEALKASEQNMRLMVDQASDAMMILNTDGVIEAVSGLGMRLLGYEEGDLVGHNVSEFAETFSRLEAMLTVEDLRRKAPKPVTASVRVKTKAGEAEWMSVSASLMNLGTRLEKYFVGFQRLSLHPALKRPSHPSSGTQKPPSAG